MTNDTDFKRSPCPITNMLDLLGDKWSLVILRDLFLGKKRYGEFVQSPEKIPTNLLAERLKRLHQAGLIDKVAYQTQPVRYEYRLTAKGQDTRPVLEAMVSWGNKYIPGTFVPPADIWEQGVRGDQASPISNPSNSASSSSSTSAPAVSPVVPPIR